MLARQGIECILPPPRTELTTFAFSSVFILLLWVRRCVLISQGTNKLGKLRKVDNWIKFVQKTHNKKKNCNIKSKTVKACMVRLQKKTCSGVSCKIYLQNNSLPDCLHNCIYTVPGQSAFLCCNTVKTVRAIADK